MNDISLLAHQFARLRKRFGEKAFDDEFITLAMREVRGMPDAAFVSFVDVCIGSRPHHKPPLLTDFREAVLAAQRRKLEQDINGALRVFNHPAAEGGLKRFLALNYPGCKSLNEAVEVRRLQLRIERANAEGA